MTDGEDYAIIMEWMHDGPGVRAVDLAICRAPTKPMAPGRLAGLLRGERIAARMVRAAVTT